MAIRQLRPKIKAHSITVQTEYSTYKVEAGLFSSIYKIKDFSEKAKDVVKKDIKTQIDHVAHNLKITKEAATLAFNEPKMINLLKATGYSFATLYGAIHMAHKVAHEGALHVIAHLAKHHVAHKVGHASGHKAENIDKWLEKYPVLKKVTGPALAGMMLYGYTLADAHSLGDWDLSKVGSALKGDFSIKDYLQTPEAVALGIHVSSGKALSLRALAENTGTLAVGLACTVIHHSDQPKLKAFASKMTDAIKAFRPQSYDKNALDDLGVDPKVVKETMHPKYITPKFKAAGDPPMPVTKMVDDPDKEPIENKGVDKKPASTKNKKEEPKGQKEKVQPEDKKGKDAGGDWWDKMSKKTKEQYKKDHPSTTLADAVPVPGTTDPYSYTNKADSQTNELTDLSILGVPKQYQSRNPSVKAFPAKFNASASNVWTEMLQSQGYKDKVKVWGNLDLVWHNTIQEFLKQCEILGVFPFNNSMETSTNEAVKDAVRAARILIVQYADECKLFNRVKVRKAFREYIRLEQGMTLISWADLYPLEDEVADGFEKWLTSTPLPRMYKMTNNRYVRYIRPHIRMWVRYINKARVRIGFEIDLAGKVTVPNNDVATREEVDDFIDRTIYFPIIRSHRFKKVHTRLF